mmetsp:Transcript_3559/g.11076  ORF Transcript_3559/g.11076 Transcript_3559/m.11076 type:complete len:287 (-) Transcript_3559:161-1021(-)
MQNVGRRTCMLVASNPPVLRPQSWPGVASGTGSLGSPSGCALVLLAERPGAVEATVQLACALGLDSQVRDCVGTVLHVRVEEAVLLPSCCIITQRDVGIADRLVVLSVGPAHLEGCRVNRLARQVAVRSTAPFGAQDRIMGPSNLLRVLRPGTRLRHHCVQGRLAHLSERICGCLLVTLFHGAHQVLSQRPRPHPALFQGIAQGLHVFGHDRRLELPQQRFVVTGKAHQQCRRVHASIPQCLRRSIWWRAQLLHLVREALDITTLVGVDVNSGHHRSLWIELRLAS